MLTEKRKEEGRRGEKRVRDEKEKIYRGREKGNKKKLEEMGKRRQKKTRKLVSIEITYACK